MTADEQPLHLANEKVRSIDPSKRTLAVESLRAVAGLLVAFAVVWWVSGHFGLQRGIGGFFATAGIFLAAALGVLTYTSGLPIHKALAAQRWEISEKEDRLRSAASRHQFTADLHDALEMSEHEPDVLQVIGRALDMVWDGPGELLLADSSRTHIHQAAESPTSGSPGCGVGTPWGCPAVRRGQVLEFSDSGGLATCPHLAVRSGELSALCVPVTVLGTPTGVIHFTGPAGRRSTTSNGGEWRRWPPRPVGASDCSVPWRPVGSRPRPTCSPGR